MEFGTNIYGAKMMNPNYFADSLNFPLFSPTAQSFHVSCEIWIGRQFDADICVAQRMYHTDDEYDL